MKKTLLRAVLPAAVVGLALGATMMPASAVSPGKNGKLAFTVYNGYSGGGCCNVYTSNRDGTQLRQVTHNRTSAAPRWSPDGTKLALTSGPDIYLMTPAGANRHKIISSGSWPTWAPSGQQLAFSRSGALYSVGVSGKGLTQLTKPPHGCTDTLPDWSPKGNLILFTRACSGHQYLTVNPKTKAVQLVTKNGAKGPLDQLSRPRFMPDGTHIVFTSLCWAVGACNHQIMNVMVTDLKDQLRTRITTMADDPPGYCDENDCNDGYESAVPAPDGHDFAVTWFTPSGAAAPCLSTLHSKFIYCDIANVADDADWQRLAG